MCHHFTPFLPPSFTLSLSRSIVLLRLDMMFNGVAIFLGLLLLLEMQQTLTMAITDCPLDLSGTNFTLAASACANKEDRGKCCRYINAFIAVSIARYTNATSNLGVNSDLSEICLRSISKTLELYGVSRNATVFCGFGTKITVNYECKGRTTVTQMLHSPKFGNVSKNCKVPLSVESNCRKCLNAGIVYLRNLIGAGNNATLSSCRDATFATLASQVDNVSAVDIASCFFGVQELITLPEPPPALLSPKASPSPLVADSPSQLTLSAPLSKSHHHYHLTLIPVIGIAVTAVAVMMLVVLIFLIHRKSRELEGSETIDKSSSKAFPQPSRKFQEGPSFMFQKFSYKETKKATNNFNTIIGQGGFGTVYKAQFSDGLLAAVKRMNKVSEQAEDEFCREIELLARLHHRHLVALRGFCIAKHERFLMYEYMANGSLKDHLHTPGRTPLSWRSRIQIAIDVANALEYLHFYCDPPLCHRDIKSSNILLDDNFVAKVADFGLAHASKNGSICFEPVSTDIRGTPGYMDPEYVITQELTEKSDVYSYGVVLLELVTARRAIQDNKNLVEWSQVFMTSESRLHELVDPSIGDSYDLDQLQTVVTIVRWCTQREGKARPSIKQVLRLLYECSDPMHSGFVEAVQDEEYEGTEGSRRTSKGKMHRSEVIFHSGDGRCLASSSSTSRSYCSRSFLLETGSPQSPSGIPSI
ncbi:probable receptor-like protein kinase At1g49730 isoform X2 [Cornus florida]|uniref:probable receptor-like protein kinase At1g49730 isoform X2 n=1 Tax=Cornus florida TaxID=4283 RepID=UPI00289C8592|nr:probable receptor-like protein kinase At1g49730 isoform X2 [Cornus florida]